MLEYCKICLETIDYCNGHVQSSDFRLESTADALVQSSTIVIHPEYAVKALPRPTLLQS